MMSEKLLDIKDLAVHYASGKDTVCLLYTSGKRNLLIYEEYLNRVLRIPSIWRSWTRLMRCLLYTSASGPAPGRGSGLPSDTQVSAPTVSYTHLGGKPVFGIAEASMRMAAMLHGGYAVITPSEKIIPKKFALARKYHCEEELRTVVVSGGNELSLIHILYTVPKFFNGKNCG